MSNPAINWSKQFDLPRREKFILFVLCERADPAGHCFPSIASLATDTSMSERSIQAGLRVLEARGLVVISGSGGRGLTRRYEVQVGKIAAFDPVPKRVQKPPKRVQERVQKSTERVQNEHQKGANDDASHRVYLLSSLLKGREPKKENQEIPPNPPPADLLASVPLPPDAVERAMGIWNATCGADCGRVVRVVNGRRILFLRRFTEDFGGSLDQWQEFCLKVAGSDFLAGKVKDWGADWDWVLEPKNLIRIVEGKFDNRRRPDPVLAAAGLDANGHMTIDAEPDNSPFARLK